MHAYLRLGLDRLFELEADQEHGAVLSNPMRRLKKLLGSGASICSQASRRGDPERNFNKRIVKII